MLDLHDMDSIPAGDNPFHHDAFSVGVSLDSIGLPNVVIMDGGKWAHGLYVVNTTTGQRVKVRGIDPHSADVYEGRSQVSYR